MQPTYIYFYQLSVKNGYVMHNKNINIIRSLHFILAYDHTFTSQLRLKTETYYKTLYKVPVTTFSLLNQRSTFERFFPDILVNAGTGENYGIRLTLKKF